MGEKNFIPLSVPYLHGREKEYVLECLDTNWISSLGRFVEEFEQKFAEYVGTKHAVAVINGTSALHLAMLDAEIGDGDLVIVPSVTFIAPVNVIRYVGADPVFIDIKRETLGLDPAKIEEFLSEACEVTEDGTIHRATKRPVRAIVPVHLYGHACEIERIAQLAKEYKLQLVEDAAEGIACRHNGRHVGGYGQTGCFSFNGNKALTTGGGGMVVTNDAKRAERVKFLATQAKSDPYYYIHDEVGYNYRLSNVQAAIGLAQLECIDEMVERKRAIHDRYAQEFAGSDAVEVFSAQEWCFCNYWMTLIRISPDRHDEFAKYMAGEKIQVRPIWSLNHTMPMYRDCIAGDLTETVALGAEGVLIPSHPGMSDDDTERAIACMKKFFG